MSLYKAILTLVEKSMYIEVVLDRANYFNPSFGLTIERKYISLSTQSNLSPYERVRVWREHSICLWNWSLVLLFNPSLPGCCHVSRVTNSYILTPAIRLFIVCKRQNSTRFHFPLHSSL